MRLGLRIEGLGFRVFGFRLELRGWILGHESRMPS